LIRSTRSPAALGVPWALAAGPAVAVVVVLLVVPSGGLLLLSLARFEPTRGIVYALTGENYLAIVRSPLYLEVIVNTLRMALIVTVGTLLLGYPVAYFMARSRSRLAGACAAIVVAPLFVSVVIRGFGWMVLLSRHGVVNRALVRLDVLGEPRQFLYTDTAVVIGLIHILCPFMILPIASVLRGIPPALEEAAWSLGADGFRVFRWVVLPLSVPGVMAGSILVYSHTIAAFVLPAMLGSIQTKLMATMLYQQVLVVGNVPLGAALAAVLVAMTFVLLTLVYRLFGVRPW
jgi:putative spermidine/putrescine transport system permease protein